MDMNFKCINLITQQHTLNIWKNAAQMKDSICEMEMNDFTGI